MPFGRHPYFVSPKQEQAEAFRDQIRAMVDRPEPNARPVGRRVLSRVA